jgi:hypothetical protein
MYKPKHRWTARQVQFLKENAYTMSDQKIADILGKTLKAIRRRRERLVMPKQSGRGIVAARIKTIKIQIEELSKDNN